MDGFFGNGESSKATTAMHGRGSSIFPLSPPQTPVRSTLAEKESLLPISSPSHKRQPSHAYAHHRRTSTSTLLRLAAAKQGLNLTPQKMVALFFIIFTATYLATFLPGPLSLILPRPSSRSLYDSADSRYAAKLPSASRSATLPVGDAAERHAWSDALHDRIPPHQHMVPSSPEAAVAAALAADLDSEAIANLAQGSRRRPQRLTKQPTANDFKAEAAAAPILVENDFFDDAPRSPPRREQPARMKKISKVAAAKGQNARIGVVPVDSSMQDERIAQDRIILEQQGSAGRRKLRNPKGAGVAMAAAAEYEALVHAKVGTVVVEEPTSTMPSEEEVASRASRYDELPHETDHVVDERHLE